MFHWVLNTSLLFIKYFVSYCILKKSIVRKGGKYSHSHMSSIGSTNSLKHAFQPISFKIRDNDPPGSLTKILKNQTSGLLENVLPTIK